MHQELQIWCYLLSCTDSIPLALLIIYIPWCINQSLLKTQFLPLCTRIPSIIGHTDFWRIKSIFYYCNRQLEEVNENLGLPSSEKHFTENFSFPSFCLLFQNPSSLRQIFTVINLDSFTSITRYLCKCLLLFINSKALHIFYKWSAHTFL